MVESSSSGSLLDMGRMMDSRRVSTKSTTKYRPVHTLSPNPFHSKTSSHSATSPSFLCNSVTSIDTFSMLGMYPMGCNSSSRSSSGTLDSTDSSSLEARRVRCVITTSTTDFCGACRDFGIVSLFQASHLMRLLTDCEFPKWLQRAISAGSVSAEVVAGTGPQTNKPEAHPAGALEVS
jgi:hypothetical protein